MRIDGVLAEARFISRLNRFLALIEIDGAEEFAHVPNTGRLRELLTMGAELIVRKYSSDARKTRYGLLLVKKNGIWVSIDSANVPNAIVHEMLCLKRLEQYAGYRNVRREVTVGGSRFDFGLADDACGVRKEYYIEVKGVTLVEDRKAFFPDAPTTRGTRHLEELAALRLAGKGAGVIFVIQREDADIITPNDATDRNFGNALRKAEAAGVDLLACVCKVDPGRRSIDVVRQVPVVTCK